MRYASIHLFIQQTKSLGNSRRADGVEKVMDLLIEVSSYVQANEPGTLRYEVNRVLRPAKDGTEDVVMLERYGPFATA